MSEKLLEIRKNLKKKRPSFHREDSHKVIKVKTKWRKPTGRHSKVRHQLKGYVKRVEPGYRSPVLIRGAHKSGLFPVIVSNISGLNSIDKDKQGIVIASGIGKRKKILLLKKSKELGLTVLNVKDIDGFVKMVNDFITARKEKKEVSKKKKESKEKEKKKKAAEKKPGLDKKLEEEKKKQEKKELDKTLSRRQK
ncbi:50S ribosomal protein L32e [Candidatus Woesearchaeota archaeon]|nr:50S ribosomal protein L32e [Candidatus Woesearchaeota archaeon]